MTPPASEMVKCVRCGNPYQMDKGCECEEIKRLRFLMDSESINWNDPEGGMFPKDVYLVTPDGIEKIKDVVTIQRNGDDVTVVTYPDVLTADVQGKLRTFDTIYPATVIQVDCDTVTRTPKRKP